MILYRDNRVTVFQSVLFRLTSTVVELDDLILIVDPAYLPNEIQEIQAHVQSIWRNKACYLLFTHGDYDHIIGYNAFPGAKTIGSLGLKNHPKKQNELDLIQDFDVTYYISRDYEVKFPEIDIVIENDSQTVTIGTTTLTCYRAPGHTEDGIFTIIDSIGLFLAGDYLSDFELPYIYQSAIEYEKTIRLAEAIIEKHQIQLLVPGHGEHTSSGTEMVRRVNMALAYIDKLKQAVQTADEQIINKLERDFSFFSQTTIESHRQNVEIMKIEQVHSQGYRDSSPDFSGNKREN